MRIVITLKKSNFLKYHEQVVFSVFSIVDLTRNFDSNYVSKSLTK